MARKRKDPMAPQQFELGQKPKVIGGFAHSLEKESANEKAPPVARSELKKQGFLK